jgi:hypothetical protein
VSSSPRSICAYFHTLSSSAVVILSFLKMALITDNIKFKRVQRARLVFYCLSV